MCDERTASRMTALNSAKRNGLTGTHIIQMVQLQQHWTYGLEAPTYTHTARLSLPKQDNASVQLPAPKLADLLNPTPANEDIRFDSLDPYNISSLFDPDDDDSDSDDNDPIITRGGTRLDIDDLIDLQNTRLVNRFDGKKTLKPSTKETKKSRGTASKEEWQPAQYKVADLDF